MHFSDLANVTVTVRSRVDKFQGDSTDPADLIETVHGEPETVPLVSLPREMIEQILLRHPELLKRGGSHGSDERRT